MNAGVPISHTYCLFPDQATTGVSVAICLTTKLDLQATLAIAIKDRENARIASFACKVT
jgi:hypothetical protein